MGLRGAIRVLPGNAKLAESAGPPALLIGTALKLDCCHRRTAAHAGPDRSNNRFAR
jgi:hypothetical protein